MILFQQNGKTGWKSQIYCALNNNIKITTLLRSNDVCIWDDRHLPQVIIGTWECALSFVNNIFIMKSCCDQYFILIKGFFLMLLCIMYFWSLILIQQWMICPRNNVLKHLSNSNVNRVKDHKYGVLQWLNNSCLPRSELSKVNIVRLCIEINI